MITVEEAYKLIQNRNPGMYSPSALDFGSFFVFAMRPYSVGPDETCFSGVIYDAVEKSNRRIFKYDLTSDIDAYYEADEIPLDNVFDAVVGGNNAKLY